jgi:signal transduction histidine kinase/DNA-binding NarL/FixJ family response regulator
VAVVAPDRLKINASIPPVVIEEIVVNEHAVERSAIGRLDAGIEKLEIHYTALSLFTPERVKFKYMLEGYDRGWVDPGARRTAYYTKVPPGDYTFRVIACNGDGVWNETGASIALSIAPRFHETRWFYLLCTIAVGSILAAGYKARTRSLKARARELESLVEERTQKLREALDQADRERLRAEDANQAKGRFLAHMSHELRTPLNAILGFVQLMQRTPARTEDDRESLSIITRSGQHLLALINDVLSMAKIESGQQSRNDAPFDLHRLVADLESLFQVRAEESGVALEMRLAPDVPRHVTGDAGKLRQVLVNLLGNAFKFTARGTVALEIEIAGPSVRFSVSDTGPGLTAEEIARLAQPFTQTATGSRAAEGTGLGLWISRRFVTLMGGELRIESTPPAGTRFSFELELPQVETADEPAPAGRVIALANMLRAPRILVAEDRAESRLFLVRLLRAVGFSVVEASNGHEAIESWRASRPDLILMDVQMPVLGGDDAIGAIRAEEASEGRPPVRIVALTAGAFEHQRESLLALGCDGFVAKPFLESTIFEAIARQLGVAYQYEVPARLRRGQGAELDLSTLARTDPAWLESVRSSLASGDVEGASRLLDRVEVQHPSMVAAMRTMIRAYRLDDLERAIAAARGEGAEP